MSTKSLIERVKLFYKLATFGDRAAFLNSFGQVLPSVTQPAGGQLTPTVGPIQWPDQELRGGKFVSKEDALGEPEQTDQTLPEQTITGYPPISTDTQDQLNKLLVPTGQIMPLKLDGRLGPETSNALKLFKEKYNKPATPESIKATYLAEAHPELETKFPA